MFFNTAALILLPALITAVPLQTRALAVDINGDSIPSDCLTSCNLVLSTSATCANATTSAPPSFGVASCVCTSPFGGYQQACTNCLVGANTAYPGAGPAGLAALAQFNALCTLYGMAINSAWTNTTTTSVGGLLAAATSNSSASSSAVPTSVESSTLVVATTSMTSTSTPSASVSASPSALGSAAINASVSAAAPAAATSAKAAGASRLVATFMSIGVIVAGLINLL